MCPFFKSGEVISCEKCFGRTWCGFFGYAQKLKNELQPGEEGYEQSRHWLVTHKELASAFHLNRTAFHHLREGKHLTLLEFERMCLAAFDIADTEQERLMMCLQVCDRLFVDGKDTEVQASAPFQHPLEEILKEMIDERVKQEVARQLRIEYYKRKSDAIK